MLEIREMDLEGEIGALFIPVCEDEQIHEDPKILKIARAAEEFEEFKGEKGDEIVLHRPAQTGVARALCMGMGPLEKLDAEALRAAAGKAVQWAVAKKLGALAIAVPSSGAMAMESEEMLTALLEGAFLGNHLYRQYRSEKKEAPLEAISLLATPGEAEAGAGLARRVETLCAGTIQAREWVSMPPNDKRPDAFAKAIVERAEAAGAGIETRVLGEEELAGEKMGALMAVAAGSEIPPRLVVLDHAPEGAKETVVLVGKGVTFDSGGINLKPAEGLKDMKMDMGGAAAAAGAVIAAAGLITDKRVIGVIPIVENMPSGTAYRPGDVVTAMTGKTIEIGNTDAEGRLILADAIAWAGKTYDPDIIIDLATLTGACVVALGERIAGVFSPDDDLAERIVASGARTFERCWRMPMPEDYRELLKSEMADIGNMPSSRWGGAITAALFLSEFAGDVRWAHVDLAGPAHSGKKSAYCGAGGTGFGVRLLCDLIERL